MRKCESILLICLLFSSACDGGNDESLVPVALDDDTRPSESNLEQEEEVEPAADSLTTFYNNLHEDAASWEYVAGEWKEDFGDGAAFGAFYFANRWDSDGNDADRKIAEETFEYNLSIVTQGAGDVA